MNRQNVGIGTALAFATALSGCAGGNAMESSILSSAPAVSAPSAPGQEIAGQNTPDQNITDHYTQRENPCMAQLDEAIPPEGTEACAKIKATGTIALVGFGIGKEVNETIATQSTIYMQLLTHGAITASFKAVQPSKEAEDFLQQKSPECIDVHKTETSAAYAAERTMPDALAEDAFVIGLTTKKACITPNMPTGVRGIAYDTLGERFADILDIHGNLEQLGLIMAPRTNLQSIPESMVIVHEALHNFNLGHANRLLPAKKERALLEKALRGTHDSTIDLAGYIRSGQHEEYGDEKNIQGLLTLLTEELTNEFMERTALNAVQLNWLRHSNQQPQPADAGEKPLEHAPARLTSGLPDTAFASLTLPKPIAATQFPKGPNSTTGAYGLAATYDKLAFTWSKDTETSRPGVTMYLASSKQRSTLDIGTMCAEAGKTIRLQLDGKTVVVTFSQSAVELRRG